MNWIHLAQDKDQWWAHVNTVMKLRAPYKSGNILINFVTVTSLMNKVPK
jgi:hypothetical protein